MSLFDEVAATTLTPGVWYRLHGHDVEVVEVAGTRVWYRRAGEPRDQQKVADVAWFREHARAKA